MFMNRAATDLQSDSTMVRSPNYQPGRTDPSTEATGSDSAWDLPRKIPPARRIFCNRTLNLRSIQAIGYDMDYTLIHYQVETWERRAFQHLREKVDALGVDTSRVEFDPSFVIRGLIVDRELGNIVKANRFGYIKRARHGGRFLDHDEQRELYGRVTVETGQPRWSFVNTFFSISSACLFAQLVEDFDGGKIPGVATYAALYDLVNNALDEAHMEGALKADIIKNPGTYIELDPETPQALLDQKQSGKRLLLITNSEWHYTAAMMSFCFDPFLPADIRWRDLFDLVLVGAGKPRFFSSRPLCFRVVNEAGDLRPHRQPLKVGEAYLGGSAQLVEESLGLDGNSILFVGDHIYSDVHASKNVRRWRTAVIVRELEDELKSLVASADGLTQLEEKMAEKSQIEEELSQWRLLAQRLNQSDTEERSPVLEGAEIQREMSRLKQRLVTLDEVIAPLARAASQQSHPDWGLLLRTGADKSYLARQIESYADIYTSRASNFLAHTPYGYFRSPRGSLPHDPFPAIPPFSVRDLDD